MMHGLGMGSLSLLSLLPLLLIGGGVVAVVLVLRNRRRGIDKLDEREIEQGAGMIQDGRSGFGSFAQEIFRLAGKRGGRLTISDVVLETGLAPREAESRMNDLVDGERVKMEVTDDGGVYYDFPELKRE
mgnify:CR=1 FL=1